MTPGQEAGYRLKRKRAAVRRRLFARTAAGPDRPAGYAGRMRVMLPGAALLGLVLGVAAAPAPTSPARAPATAPSARAQALPGLGAGVQAALAGVPDDVQVGVWVQDLTTGRVLETLTPGTTFIPASTIKLLTGAAVLLDRQGLEGWWSAELTVPAAQAGQARVKALTLRGSGDPTLTVRDGAYSLRALARQAHARGVREVGELRLDDGSWQAGSWEDAVIGVPMTALRLAEWYDDPPATAAEARTRLASALAAELRAAGIRVLRDAPGVAAPSRLYVPPARQDDQGNPLPPDPVIPAGQRPEVGVAGVRSASVRDVLYATERPSDNLRAEELLATLAPRRGGSLPLALKREGALLAGAGVNLTGAVLADGSGLSRENRLTPRTLGSLLKVMHDLPYPLSARPGEARAPGTLYAARQNVFAEMLPQAGTGETGWRQDGRGGTLARRLLDSGLDVRAKTGTLPGVSALAGYVTGKSGHTLAFALLMNGPEDTPILTLRAVQDRAVQALAAVH